MRIESKPLAGVAIVGVVLAGGLALAAPHLHRAEKAPRPPAVAPPAVGQPVNDPALLGAITNGGPALPNAPPRYAAVTRPAATATTAADQPVPVETVISPDQLDAVAARGPATEPPAPTGENAPGIQANASAAP